MAARRASSLRLLAVGSNHASGAALLRDRLFIADARVPDFLAALRGAGLQQALALSTCDRVEVQAAHDDPGRAAKIVAEALAAEADMSPAEVMRGLYVHAGRDAARHIFAVAASLDSQTIGEPQVLGQLKAGHRQAREAGTMGPELEAVLQAAYAAAKRVRNETTIAEGPVSIAAAAAQLARDVHGDLGAATGLLLGDGDMGELMARYLLESGLGRLLLAAPSEARGQAAAARLDCHVTPFEGFAAQLPSCEIVVASLGGRRHLISKEMMEGVLLRRRRRPVYLIDAATPGDIDPAVHSIDGAFLYDLEDLERVATQGRATREAAAADAWAVLDDELESFERDRAGRRAAPAITALRGHFEEMREEVLRGGKLDAEAATRQLVNRLLHDPSETLRELAETDGRRGGRGQRALAERVLRRLFRLGDGDNPENKK